MERPSANRASGPEGGENMSPERIKPISPKEVANEKQRLFPNEVFEAFNEMIVQNAGGGGGRISVDQGEVVDLMVKKGLNRDLIFKNGWLDVEDVYRKAGWKVEYDKPGYNEDYSAYFIFSRSDKG